MPVKSQLTVQVYQEDPEEQVEQRRRVLITFITTARGQTGPSAYAVANAESGHVFEFDASSAAPTVDESEWDIMAMYREMEEIVKKHIVPKP